MVIPDKWIGIPLWNGDQLIGTVCMDLGNKVEKWNLINRGIKSQLQIGGEFLASTFKNLLSRIRLERSRNLIKIISDLSNKENNVELLLKKLSENEHCTIAIWYEIESSVSKITIENSPIYNIKYIAYNGELINNKNPDIEISISKYDLLHPDNEFKICCDVCMEHLNIRRVIDLVEEFNFEKISKISIPIQLREKSDNPRYVLKLITGVGKGDIPFTYYDFQLYKDVIGKHFADLYRSNYERASIFKIIKSITQKITDTRQINELTNFLFEQIYNIFPETMWFLYLKNKNNLELIYKSPHGDLSPSEFKQSYKIFNAENDRIQLLNNNDYSLTVDFFNQEFDNNFKYYKNRDELVTFLTKRIGSINGTKYERENEKIVQFSELIIQIHFKGNHVGILKMQEIKDNAFDYDFINFTLIFAELIGNIVGLLEEIEEKKRHEESLTHALRSPIVSAKGAIETYPRLLLIKNVEDYLSMDKNSKIFGNYPKYWLYRMLYRLKSSINVSNFYVDNIDALNFTKYQFKTDTDIRRILMDICFLKMDEAKINKKGLFININDLITTGKKTHKIKGDEGKLKLAFFNLTILR